jgi:hypothetical protein
VRDSAGIALERFPAFVPSFVFVNQNLINEQMQKYSCTDESCLLSFAREAKIDCLIFVSAEEDREFVRVTYTARVPSVPYGGKAVKTYTAFIPKSGYSLDVMTAATEEHAGRFLSLLLESVSLPLDASVSSGRLNLPEKVSGRREVFRRIKGSLFYETAGTDSFNEGVSEKNGYDPGESYFVLRDFTREGNLFSEYIYGRKHEMLFGPSQSSRLSVLAFVPVISAVSPVALPLGYYRNSDYRGLLYSGCAMTPWAVISARYLKTAYWDKDSHLTRREKGGRNFGLYWVFAGNASLVVDMYAHEALKSSANYRQEEYLGSTGTAAGLAALTPGGGMFYRGERLYGHLYYQAGTFLMYKTMMSFAAGEKYDPDTGRYEKVKADRKKGYAWLAGFLALKGCEIIHASVSRDNIDSGYDTAGISFLPVMEYDNGLRCGAGLAFRW